MRAKMLIFVSLVINVALGAALVQAYLDRQRPARRLPDREPVTVVSNTPYRIAKTNVILRPREINWPDIESTNYESYVMNLRAIGCPESTVRDIIVADVNQLYARKRKEMNTTTNDLKWWMSDPDPEEAKAALDKAQELETERRRLLARLLGAKWETSEDDKPEPLTLTGEILSSMSPELKQTVQAIVSRSRESLRDYLRQCDEAGEPPDPVELAQFREATRAELEKQLSRDQLREFLLRYSSNASQLRQELRGFNATPEEFQKLFAATDSIDRKLQLLGADEDSAERKALEEQRLAAIRQVLDPRRYETYRVLTDSDYRAAYTDAQEAGAPAQANKLYDIFKAGIMETERINNDSSLTDAQKQQALKIVKEQQQAARAVLLGLESPTPSREKAPAANIFQHQVGPHESLAGLSLYYRVPLTDLMQANPGLSLGVLPVGVSVKIPNPPPFPWQPGIVPAR